MKETRLTVTIHDLLNRCKSEPLASIFTHEQKTGLEHALALAHSGKDQAAIRNVQNILTAGFCTALAEERLLPVETLSAQANLLGGAKRRDSPAAA